MRRVLRKVNLSAKHLWILDRFLRRNDVEYQRMEQKLNQKGIPYKNFCKELYFGGSATKRRGDNKGARQMILSDLLQYIITSRSYYMATKNEEYRSQFVEILMYLLNQWLLMDSFGSHQSLILRRDLIDELKENIKNDFCENQDRYHTDRLNETYDYQNDIIPDPPNQNPPNKRILETYDSFFPKIRGGLIELLVYIYLLQRRLGFVVSLLIQQRLLSGLRPSIAPPDILLLRSKKEIVGLEIGRGKEKQSADFSLLTSIPTFSIDIVERQPFRCDGCGRWIIYCDKIIEFYSYVGVPNNHDYIIYCVDCPHFNGGSCRDIIFHGEATNRYGVTREARYHLRCIDAARRREISADFDQYFESLVAYYPLVKGLEDFSEETL